MKKISILCSLFVLALLIGGCKQKAPASADSNDSSLQLPRTTPEQEGVSSAALLAFVDAIEAQNIEFHSFMLLRHGNVISEGWWKPYDRQYRQTVYSASKTFTSTAIGFAVTEGKLKLSDRVVSFFPDKLPDSVSPNLAQMTVKNLLTMATGQANEPTEIRLTDDWVAGFLATTVEFEPGSRFAYNSAATFMLSAILQKVTGERTFDYLKPRLFEPLGITDIDWELSPDGYTVGGWGLRVHTEDMAKLGQLYLQKGIWKGKQILPKSWIEEASSAQIMQDPDAPKNIKDIDDSKQGYGYQIWRGRHNTYRADGAFAQFIVVMADFDAVIAIQCYERDIQKVSNCLWDYLLPAFKSDKPLPADSLAKQNLQKRLDALEIKPLCTQNKLQLPAANQWRANLLADTLSAEATLTLYGNGDSIRLDWKTDSLNSGAFVFGDCAWLHGQVWRQPPSLIPVPSTWREFPPFNVFGSCRWQSETVLELDLRYIETPHTERWIVTFESDAIKAVEYKTNAYYHDPILIYRAISELK